MPTFNNIASNFNSVDLPRVGRFWFSYKTCVAFMPFSGSRAYETIVHCNDWSTTTGKHLNAIDGGDKKSRLSAEAFAAVFAECFPAGVSC